MKLTILAAFALTLSASTAFADTYAITVTNNLADELFAPIVVTDVNNDSHIFAGSYVTEAAEEQVLSGDPAKVVASIGEADVAVGHGTDGPPGVLLKAGASIKFTIDTDATAIRIFAMVAPTITKDHYVTAIADVHATDGLTVNLDRFDIGHDEGTKVTSTVSQNVGTVTITKM